MARAVPILPADDLAAARTFYVEKLGFQVEWLASDDTQAEDQVLYHILDALADAWDPAIQEIDRRVDIVEAAVLSNPRQSHLTTIYRLKQEVGELNRRAAPQRAAHEAAPG